jgi:uncharacterized protein (UPF0248 family)
MIPVRELLDRIRWDREFGKGRIEIGYCDHGAGAVVRVPLEALRFEEGNRFSFQLEAGGGKVLSIPFHRIREVLRDGLPIWRRPDRPPPGRRGEK